MRAPLYTFTPLREADLALVRRWLLEPHVARWWDDGTKAPYPDAEIADYREAILGRDPTYRYLAYISGQPVGIFQHYRVADSPEYENALSLDEDAIGLDLFIGEPSLIGRGHGPRMLREFLGVVAFGFWLDKDITVCVIGPSVSNLSAIRAYEKAGFRFVRDVVVPGEAEPEHLMRLTRDELAHFAASSMQ